MQKKKAAKLGGFVGALCATGALIGLSVSGTGAYFTDSHDGTIAASSGHLTLSNVGPTDLNFSNLMPGTDQNAAIPYQVSVSSGKVDLWLVFDPTSSGYGHFTGAKGTSYNGYTDGGLGRYGHFAVSNGSDVAFQSRNLQLATNPTQNCADGTVTNPTTGRGGSDVESTTSDECGAPAAIELASNLSDGNTGTVNVTYGLSGKQTQQNQTETTVGYKLVATQAGHAPNDQNNP